MAMKMLFSWLRHQSGEGMDWPAQPVPVVAGNAEHA